ncbi:hypothetical protein [Siphonobacter sp. SORGH_AS_1065]|uniref:hypothetical protein n=1 Tax=Siphonobacter sp. SORGH_AS_1065 TaxID=3041795 RepID=UPI00278472C6|nr:hypothetical protein [Siphonobacter sp. SORGH_AS_1065]MDQ1086827.1 Spy/CpxP family protein refolding chaperone [Siphonobacter sp. SORGH_AS_1065]
MKTGCLSLLFIAALTACQNPPKEDLTKFQKEVEGMHDKIMGPYMQIADLQEEIRQQIAKDTTQRAQGDSLIEALGKAEKGMDEWMGSYNGDTLLDLSPEKGKAYLEAEKAKVTAVEQQTSSSVAAAKAFLKK